MSVTFGGSTVYFKNITSKYPISNWLTRNVLAIEFWRKAHKHQWKKPKLQKQFNI